MLLPRKGRTDILEHLFFLLLKRYEQLLSDCHAAYFNQRLSLLRPSVVASLTDLSTTYVRDHCSLSRCSCTFLLRICHDEWQLYHQFFGLQSPLLEWVAVSLFANWSVNLRFSFFSPFSSLVIIWTNFAVFSTIFSDRTLYIRITWKLWLNSVSFSALKWLTST